MTTDLSWLLEKIALGIYLNGMRMIVGAALSEQDDIWHAKDGYSPVFAAKGHARIIWDCCWMHEEDIFATASRDKTVGEARDPIIVDY